MNRSVKMGLDIFFVGELGATRSRGSRQTKTFMSMQDKNDLNNLICFYFNQTLLCNKLEEVYTRIETFPNFLKCSDKT